MAVANPGDVFTLKINNKDFGVGQIVSERTGELYVVFYAGLSDKDNVDVSLLQVEKIILAGLTLDAKFYHGDWKIVGSNHDVAGQVPQPVFKVVYDNSIFLESRDRKAAREAKSHEVSDFEFRKIVAPVRFENAFKAFHGVGEWLPRYEPLLSSNFFKSSNVIL